MRNQWRITIPITAFVCAATVYIFGNTGYAATIAIVLAVAGCMAR